MTKYLTLICGLKALESEIMSDPSGVSPVTGGNDILFDENVGGVSNSGIIIHCHIILRDMPRID